MRRSVTRPGGYSQTCKKEEKEGQTGEKKGEGGPQECNWGGIGRREQIKCLSKRPTFDRTFSREVVFKQILALSALEETPFRIRSAVMPSDRTLLDLDMASGCPLGRERKKRDE